MDVTNDDTRDLIMLFGPIITILQINDIKKVSMATFPLISFINPKDINLLNLNTFLKYISFSNFNFSLREFSVLSISCTSIFSLKYSLLPSVNPKK